MASFRQREIRADFDRDTIVVYQAYSNAIADTALKAGRFVPPFSTTRMTWIKPSFLWLMERSNWGMKSGQERVMAIRITREGWESALRVAVLTNYERSVSASPEQWRADLDAAQVQVQWDPDRSLRGASLEVEAIQVGIGRGMIEHYVSSWTREIVDMTATVHKMRRLIDVGDAHRAKALLPPERVYAMGEPALARRLGMTA